MAKSASDNSITIREEQRRRADNQIWNAAGKYDFRPPFRAYDDEGNAELYWNSVIGAVAKHYGADLDPLFEAVHAAIAEDLCEQLTWISLENACFEKESRERPAFPLLRRSYALRILEKGGGNLPHPYDEVWRIHFLKAAGRTEETEQVSKEASACLGRLELSGELSGREIAEQVLAYLDERTLLIPKELPPEAGKRHFWDRLRPRPKKIKPLPQIRPFASGFGEHGDPKRGEYVDTGRHFIADMSEKQSDAAIADFVRGVFGTSLFDEARTAAIERTLCCGDHENCHLYFASGDGKADPGLGGYAGIVRKEALRKMEANRLYYEENRAQARTAVNRLTEKWINAFLVYSQDNTVRSSFGEICPNRIWRSETVNDSWIFDKKILADSDGICVDILIDASISQEERQKRVALQGYIIAESLTRCHIPVRVSSYSSLSGYTVLTRYRDYEENDANERIFNYTTFGCNRDGLAVKLLGYLSGQDARRPEQHILILLSDTRPNDTINIVSSGESVPYTEEAAVRNTAQEVRFLRNKGTSVLCVFTGADRDLPAAKTIYGREFVRIRSFDKFADAVGNLVLTQILAGM